MNDDIQENSEEEKDTELLKSDEEKAKVIEGLLFLTGEEGLNAEQAAASTGLSAEEADRILQLLEKRYDESQHGFLIRKYGDNYRFLSAEFVNPYAKKLFQINKDVRLSNAALETLAVIAYKQPVTRVEIEEIRGVSADMMLKKLEARGLIQECGRSEAPGRPFLYEVTDEFMNAFSLESLDELPDLPDFQNEEGEDDLFRQ